MDDKKYINFDEAVTFLGTTRSTLYKWLQAGKVPGHKLGRQWRFLEAELSKFASGNTHEYQQLQKFQQLEKLFLSRAKKRKENEVNQAKKVDACEVAEKLVWDATNSGATGVHIQPKNGLYEVTYRNTQDLESITTIDKLTFIEINNYFQQVSSPIRKENKRRFFLGKKQGEGKVDLHIRYQQMETVTGNRVTLKIHRSDHPANCLKAISHNKDLETLERWCSADHGIIVITGPAGSGKTTTIHCAIHDLLRKNKVIFTLEDPVDFIIEGANQVEVDLKNSEKVEETFNSIYDSDLDVLCLGLSTSESEDTILKAAKKAASSGHLVLLQMHESSVQDAFSKLQSTLGNSIGELIVGISSQKLERVNDLKSRKAKYKMESGKLDKK